MAAVLQAARALQEGGGNHLVAGRLCLLILTNLEAESLILRGDAPLQLLDLVFELAALVRQCSAIAVGSSFTTWGSSFFKRFTRSRSCSRNLFKADRVMRSVA